jgi:hypothetical protein
MCSDRDRDPKYLPANLRKRKKKRVGQKLTLKLYIYILN